MHDYSMIQQRGGTHTLPRCVDGCLAVLASNARCATKWGLCIVIPKPPPIHFVADTQLRLQVLDRNGKNLRDVTGSNTNHLDTVLERLACLGVPEDPTSEMCQHIGVKAQVRIWNNESTTAHVSNHSLVPMPVGPQVAARLSGRRCDGSHLG